MKEVAESDSQKSSDESSSAEPINDSLKQERMEKLQMDIMEAQRHLFRLQAEYNDEMTTSNVGGADQFTHSLGAQNNPYRNVDNFTTIGKEQ